MRSLPDKLDEGELRAALSAWQLEDAELEYLAIGGGSYHWLARRPGGPRCFVCVDDLERKPWFGDGADACFAGMRAALATAQALRQRAGLGFVVAPIAGRDGIDVQRVDHRHSVAVMPFLEGRSGHFGETLLPAHRAQLVQLLAELHRATATVAAIAPRRGVELPGRTLLETALCDLERPWTGGPFGEPARALLSESAGAVRAMLAEFDHLAAAVTAAGAPPVVTHGEPHPGNLIWARDRPLLVDWDTVALALPERDIWMLAGDGGSDLSLYAELTNRRTDPHALTLYQLAWDLGDMTVFVDSLRAAHERNADAEHAWRSLAAVTAGRTVPPLR